jgi:hypothetical protein
MLHRKPFIIKTSPMIYTLSDLQAGRVAVVNDGTREQLIAVLRAAWPNDTFNPKGAAKYYEKYKFPEKDEWMDSEHTFRPTQSVSLFSLREEPQERVLWEEVLFHLQHTREDDEAEIILYLQKHFNITKK